MKLYATLNEREQSMIRTQTNISTGPNASAALTHENVTWEDGFAAVFLDAKTTSGRIATVAG